MNEEAIMLQRLGRLRWRMGIALSLVMLVVYFGFILLVAFNKAAMGVLLTRGLSVGILLGCAVIALTWGTTWFYVWWANRYVDGEVASQNKSRS